MFTGMCEPAVKSMTRARVTETGVGPRQHPVSVAHPGLNGLEGLAQQHAGVPVSVGPPSMRGMQRAEDVKYVLHVLIILPQPHSLQDIVKKRPGCSRHVHVKSPSDLGIKLRTPPLGVSVT